MAKDSLTFQCQSCGNVTSKWIGKCTGCGEWNTIIEATSQKQNFSLISKKGKNTIILGEIGSELTKENRVISGIEEFDLVLGQGITEGSSILIGGDPGIGKSTLLLQVADNISKNYPNQPTIYITGEESETQVKQRALRLNIKDSKVKLANATKVEEILKLIEETRPICIIIDSIQTMFLEAVESSPGTVTQVRASAFEIISLCKRLNVIAFFVGHVTKEGQIAGPKVLEHMVDTVLYFEGDKGLNYRLIRSIKNRFGSANEIGVFEMSDRGLNSVSNPSKLFISETSGETPGSVLFPGIEGSRVVMVEIQALITPTNMSIPRRAVIGWDINRLSMVLAILQNYCGIVLYDKEIYLNVTGGYKINEPGADLAVAIAIYSNLAKLVLPSKPIVFGEIGLSGEVREVSNLEKRLKEARKLGFSDAITNYKGAKNHELKNFTIKNLSNIKNLKSVF